MKNKQLTFATFLLLFISFSLISCEDKVVTTRTFTAYSPIYMSYDDLRASVKISSKSENVELNQPGKIYFKDNLIFINELHKGVHVYNNQNPESPEHIAFIEIPGNVDIAIRNNVLFADSYVDLVSIDISDLNNIHEIHREKDIFQYTLPETDYQYPTAKFDETKGVITSWEVKEVKETIEYQPNRYYYLSSSVDFAMGEGIGGMPQVGVSTGTGGSMARFIIYGNTFYVLKSNELEVFDVVSDNSFTSVKKINMIRVAETVFINNKRLFIGTQTGMEIYDLSDAENPTYLSDFNHVQSCDPVVVEGNLAYVTLRSGTMCGGMSNQLDVIDISNITTPELIKTYPMTSPHGLGIKNNTLFICDGEDGLKIYDASNSLTIADNMLQHFPEIVAFDVIPLENVLLTIASDGLYQYDYSNLSDIKLLSKIQILPSTK